MLNIKFLFENFLNSECLKSNGQHLAKSTVRCYVNDLDKMFGRMQEAIGVKFPTSIYNIKSLDELNLVFAQCPNFRDCDRPNGNGHAALGHFFKLAEMIFN